MKLTKRTFIDLIISTKSFFNSIKFFLFLLMSLGLVHSGSQAATINSNEIDNKRIEKMTSVQTFKVLKKVNKNSTTSYTGNTQLASFPIIVF